MWDLGAKNYKSPPWRISSPKQNYKISLTRKLSPSKITSSKRNRLTKMASISSLFSSSLLKRTIPLYTTTPNSITRPAKSPFLLNTSHANPVSPSGFIFARDPSVYPPDFPGKAPPEIPTVPREDPPPFPKENPVVPIRDPEIDPGVPPEITADPPPPDPMTPDPNPNPRRDAPKPPLSPPGPETPLPAPDVVPPRPPEVVPPRPPGPEIVPPRPTPPDILPPTTPGGPSIIV